jgi:hypothetical protein
MGLEGEDTNKRKVDPGLENKKRVKARKRSKKWNGRTKEMG